MNKIFLAMISLFLVFSVKIYAADLYIWKDKNGVSHISDQPAPNTEHADVVRDATPDPPPDTRQAAIKQELFTWRQSLDYHTSRCLQQKSEAVCKSGEKMDRANIDLLNKDPDQYFKSRGRKP